jgi:hypothetical protein
VKRAPKLCAGDPYGSRTGAAVSTLSFRLDWVERAPARDYASLCQEGLTEESRSLVGQWEQCRLTGGHSTYLGA